MFNFLSLLSDYKNENDKTKQMMEEDDIQDKIVLYNEIIDVMKCIYFIFLQKHNKIFPNKELIKPITADQDLM